MKKWIFTLFLACSAVGFSDEKVYVQLRDLMFDANGIRAAGVPARESTSLHVDECGYYMYKEESRWICPKCYTSNGGKRPYCKNCKWPLFDDSHP